MIQVCIIRDSEGVIREFSVKGHAGYAESGRDIVCAAVSAVAYTAVGALEDLAGLNGYEEKEGYIKFSLPLHISREKTEKAGIILETAAIGFKQIEMQYGDYVKVSDEEV
jgi:uncharacterized protein YsxB (DUF464 family)